MTRGDQRKGVDTADKGAALSILPSGTARASPLVRRGFAFSTARGIRRVCAFCPTTPPHSISVHPQEGREQGPAGTLPRHFGATV